MENLAGIFQMVVLVLSIQATFFLAKGNLGLTPGVIAQLATTKWGYNSAVIDNLAEQKADSWVGNVQILLSLQY